MNYTMDNYSKPKYCYDHPVMDVYGALCAVVIWVFILNWLANVPYKIINVDKANEKRIAELNENLENADAEVVNLSNQVEVLDEKLRVVTEQLRLANEDIEARTARTVKLAAALRSTLFPGLEEVRG
jgi:peptidoglycan hydrolase CwlO-like protein